MNNVSVSPAHLLLQYLLALEMLGPESGGAAFRTAEHPHAATPPDDEET